MYVRIYVCVCARARACVCVCVCVCVCASMYSLRTPVDGCLVTVRSGYNKTVFALQIVIKTTNFMLWFKKQLFVTKLHIFQYHYFR